VDQDDEVGLIENKKDLDIFANQMKYNIVLCHINLNDIPSAIALCQKMNIELDQLYYSDFVNFKKFVAREVEIFKKD
jgi:hypothetical protein